MIPVLEKVQRLERYIQTTEGQVDWIIENTLDKLLQRERQKLLQQRARLRSQIADFEVQYGWMSEVFYPRFERGELGDDMNFIEWSATIEMVEHLEQAIADLGESTEE